MMRVIFTIPARRELDEAASFYELEQSGLASDFRRAVRDAALRIVEYPQAWSIERGDVRKYILRRFPYKLLYSIEDDHILISALAHQHRKPEYWIDRWEA
jgi:plasmid stabilization system protein ParE